MTATPVPWLPSKVLNIGDQTLAGPYVPFWLMEIYGGLKSVVWEFISVAVPTNMFVGILFLAKHNLYLFLSINLCRGVMAERCPF